MTRKIFGERNTMETFIGVLKNPIDVFKEGKRVLKPRSRLLNKGFSANMFQSLK